MAQKAPAFQFYVKDWLTDVELQACTAATRGIWINALCLMWTSRTRGILSGEDVVLARMLNCNMDEFEAFLNEAEAYRFCDISVTCHGEIQKSHREVTLTNRRMWKEEKDREDARLRKQKQREKGKNGEVSRQSHEKVTSPSSSSSSSSSSKSTSYNTLPTLSNSSSYTTPEPENGEGVCEEKSTPDSVPKKLDCPSKGRASRSAFMVCWDIYPVKQNQEAAWREWCRLEDNGTLADSWIIQDRIMLLLAEDARWADGYAPEMSKWLRDKRWDDEPVKRQVSQATASTQAQKNSQDRESMAQAILQSEGRQDEHSGEQRRNLENTGKAGRELPCGYDRTGSG